ncbi:hypothetical protein H6F74_27960 [Trichocoleus sp. FACHB-90]|nr:hypothetical protein [Trichocoleus sp. FACHB-90]
MSSSCTQHSLHHMTNLANWVSADTPTHNSISKGIKVGNLLNAKGS